MTSSTQFLLFSIVGGFAALVNIVARLMFNIVAPFEIAVVLAFPLALTTAFFLNRQFVFKARDGEVASQYACFLMINVVALLQVFVVSVLLARLVFPWAGFRWQAETVAHVVGVLSPILSSYLLHKNFTFGAAPKKSRDSQEQGLGRVP